MNKKPADFSGILVLDKPSGFTSHDAVSKLRKLFNTRQIGHTGTLDPSATGVLPILCGRAVKASEYLSAHDKGYEAKFLLGYVSDTGDTDGKVEKTGKPLPSEEQVLAAVKSMVGCRMQLPPMTSAIKVNGKKLMDYARAGESVEVSPRPVEIYSAAAEKITDEEYSLSLSVSKGTYVRAFVTELGEILGCGGVMSSLRRTKSGNFTLEGSITLEQLEEMDIEERKALLLPLDDAFSDLEELSLAPFFARLARNGCEIYQKKISKNYPLGKRLRLYEGGEFFGLGEVMEFEKGSAIKVIKLFSI